MTRTLLDSLQGAIRNVCGNCADCGGPIGQDKGPTDGWQLEDNRIVCHACCVNDFHERVDAVLNSRIGLTNDC